MNPTHYRILYFLVCIICTPSLTAQIFKQTQLICLNDAYYTADRIEGDSIVLKVQLELNQHPDFKDMPAAPPEIRLRYYTPKDTTLFYQQFLQEQYIYKAYVDFEISFDKITRNTRASQLFITQTYIRNLSSEGYSSDPARHPDFKQKLYIRNAHIDSLFWFNIHFADSVFIDDMVSRNQYITNCIFEQPVHIADVNSAHIEVPFNSRYVVSESTFLKDFTFYRKSSTANMVCSRCTVYGKATLNNWGYDYDTPQKDTTTHFFAVSSTFEHLNIKDKLRGLDLSRTSVHIMLQLDETDFEDQAYNKNQNLKKLFLSPGAIIFLNNSQNLTEYELNLSQLQNAKFMFSPSRVSVENPDNHYPAIQQQIEYIKQYTSNYPTANQTQKEDVLAWLDYQAENYRREYYRIYLNENGNRWKLFTSTTLEILVRNGYRGEWRFCGWSALLILLFAAIYTLFFRTTVDAYVVNEEFINPANPKPSRLKPEHKTSPHTNYLLSTMRSVWFSFVVFINPRFPSKYFKFYKSLLLIIIAEWAIGLFMLIIFAWFIAAKFPFIKALFGL